MNIYAIDIGNYDLNVGIVDCKNQINEKNKRCCPCYMKINEHTHVHKYMHKRTHFKIPNEEKRGKGRGQNIEHGVHSTVPNVTE